MPLDAPTLPGRRRLCRLRRRLLIGVGVLLQAFCLAALVQLAGGPWILGRPPLGRITALALDGAGNVYLADADYIVVHVYRSDGTFVRAVRSPIRPTYMHVDDVGRIRVYDDNHVMAAAEPASDSFVVHGRVKPAELPARRSEAVGPAGESYRLEPPARAAVSNVPPWYPKVVKVMRGGDRQVIIVDPLRLWLMRAPLPAAYFWIAGIFMIMTATGWSRATGAAATGGEAIRSSPRARDVKRRAGITLRDR